MRKCKKKYINPECKNLSLSDTFARPENKCTNNNGNGANCERNPSGEGYYEGPMFYCQYYVKQGHLCNSQNVTES